MLCEAKVYTQITKTALILRLKPEVFVVRFSGLKIVGLKPEVLNRQFSIKIEREKMNKI